MDRLTKDLAEALEFVLLCKKQCGKCKPCKARIEGALLKYRAQLAREEQDRQGLIYS